MVAFQYYSNIFNKQWLHGYHFGKHKDKSHAVCLIKTCHLCTGIRKKNTHLNLKWELLKIEIFSSYIFHKIKHGDGWIKLSCSDSEFHYIVHSAILIYSYDDTKISKKSSKVYTVFLLTGVVSSYNIVNVVCHAT